MESKSSRFLTQFSRAVFQQWTQTAERQQFWSDGDFLHGLVEEAVTKLPRGKLKSHLIRDLNALGVRLAALLRELHGAYVQQQQHDKWSSSGSSLTHCALLNEEHTELELLQAAALPTSDRLRQLAGVLALDAGIDIAKHTADEQEEDASQLVETLTLIAARSYETPEEQTHKRGLILHKLAKCVQKQVEQMCTSNWECSEGSAAGKQVQALRALLERVIVQDALELARLPCDEHQHGESSGLKAPWTSFFCLEESKELKKVEFDAEVAKIYGAMLTLAVYFPIEFNDDSDDEKEGTSDDSSSDEEKTSLKKSNKPRKVDAVGQAQLTTRQVLFAAQMRQCGVHDNGQWLVAVLSFLQGLPKPATYLDEDEDEIFGAQDRRALLNCLAQVYSRTFASVEIFDRAQNVAEEKKAAVQDRNLFDGIVCLRHAAQFMRVELKSGLPAITTAMAHLAGVPLPSSFITWLDLEQTATPSSAFEKATQQLWSLCGGQAKMANVLLSSTNVTANAFQFIQKGYLTYLQVAAAGMLSKARRPQIGTSSATQTEEATADSNLFFMDNAGGEEEEPITSKDNKKRACSKERHGDKAMRAVELEEAPSKRSRS